MFYFLPKIAAFLLTVRLVLVRCDIGSTLTSQPPDPVPSTTQSWYYNAASTVGTTTPYFSNGFNGNASDYSPYQTTQNPYYAGYTSYAPWWGYPGTTGSPYGGYGPYNTTAYPYQGGWNPAAYTTYSPYNYGGFNGSNYWGASSTAYPYYNVYSSPPATPNPYSSFGGYNRSYSNYGGYPTTYYPYGGYGGYNGSDYGYVTTPNPYGGYGDYNGSYSNYGGYSTTYSPYGSYGGYGGFNSNYSVYATTPNPYSGYNGNVWSYGGYSTTGYPYYGYGGSTATLPYSGANPWGTTAYPTYGYYGYYGYMTPPVTSGGNYWYQTSSSPYGYSGYGIRATTPSYYGTYLSNNIYTSRYPGFGSGGYSRSYGAVATTPSYYGSGLNHPSGRGTNAHTYSIVLRTLIKDLMQIFGLAVEFQKDMDNDGDLRQKSPQQPEEVQAMKQAIQVPADVQQPALQVARIDQLKAVMKQAAMAAAELLAPESAAQASESQHPAMEKQLLQNQADGQQMPAPAKQKMPEPKMESQRAQE